MDGGVGQIVFVVLVVVGLALLVSGIVQARRAKWGAFAVRGTGGIVVALVAVVLLWIVTLVQTFLGLTGEVKAAHVVARALDGQQHQMVVDLTLYGDAGHDEQHLTYQVEGDMWMLQANIVELEPWVNALGFHSGYKISRLFGQRLDGVATSQHHIFLNGGDQDFFADMRDNRWWTGPFVRSAYGNAVVAVPGEYDVYISRDAIKTRAVGG
ncbi:hypothetical protein GCM10023318_37050 [Nocardia callitridis]|uniref:DUF4190 domain-containing protein n=1 Tax=Nocardia callitridis TaxID=648753 RepID=A0ABP9KIR3_9NOCA